MDFEHGFTPKFLSASDPLALATDLDLAPCQAVDLRNANDIK